MPGFNIGGSGGEQIISGPNSVSEPRRTYRWIFETLDGMNQNALVYLKTCSRPNVTLEPIEMHHNQERAWFAGRTNWEAISMNWYDIEQDLDTSQSIYDWLEVTTQIPDANVSLPSTYKKKGKLQMTDHEGSAKETWELHNCWPTNVNWNELDYSTNDIVLISVSMRYDRAVRQ